MKIYNNTPQSLLYTISGGGSIDCGNIDPSQTADLPFYDNQDNVMVSFSSSLGPSLAVEIPESKTGMAVTIGTFFE